MSFEWKFRLQLWLMQSRLLTPLTWLLSLRAPKDAEFGTFDDCNKYKSILDIRGMLKPPDGRYVSIEEMNAWRTSVDKGHPLQLVSKLDDKKLENDVRLAGPGGSVSEIEAATRRRFATKLDSGKGSGMRVAELITLLQMQNPDARVVLRADVRYDAKMRIRAQGPYLSVVQSVRLQELDSSIDRYEPDGGASWLEFEDDRGGEPGVLLR